MATVDLWLTAGQSNMVGRGDGSLAPTTDPALSWEWDEDGTLVQLEDPGVADGGYVPTDGSCVPAFANALAVETGRPSVFVRGAIGNTALLESNDTGQGNWSESGTRFNNAVNRATTAIADVEAAGHTVGRVNVLWSQGETDASGGNDLDTYQAATEALLDRFRSALSWPDLKVYVFRTGTRDGGVEFEPAGYSVVRDGQDAACVARSGLVMVYTKAIDFFDLGWMQDDEVHYNQDGYNDMGSVGGAAVAADLAADEDEPSSPSTSAHRTNAADLMFAALG